MKTLMISAAVAALLAPSAALAHEGECIDMACAMVSLFDTPQAQGSNFTGTDAPRFGTWGFDIAGMDRSVQPGDDFFRYANGAALDAMVIPADRRRYGSFDMLAQLSDNRLRTLIDGLATDTTLQPGSDGAKIRDLYNSYMDVDRVEALDDQPLRPLLAEIRQATTREAIAAYMGRTVSRPGSSFFGPAIADDAKDPSKYAVYLFRRASDCRTGIIIWQSGMRRRRRPIRPMWRRC